MGGGRAVRCVFGSCVARKNCVRRGKAPGRRDHRTTAHSEVDASRDGVTWVHAHFDKGKCALVRALVLRIRAVLPRHMRNAAAPHARRGDETRN